MRICLINCYFGEWPTYFKLFLSSCKKNSEIDFIVFSDIYLEDVSLPDNVKIINLDLQSFIGLASRKLGLLIDFRDSYKLNDFKPTYGVIFADYLTSYDFWGHIDIDVIFGDIRNILTHSILTQYDVISGRKEFMTGFFSLYRNCELVNNLFRESKDFKFILEDAEHHCFDECNFAYSDMFKGKSILNVETETQSMTYVVAKAHSEQRIRLLMETLVEEFNPLLRWTNGKLTSEINKKEFLLFHLINFKNSLLFRIPKNYKESDSFRVSYAGISFSLFQFLALQLRAIWVKAIYTIRYVFRILLFKNVYKVVENHADYIGIYVMTNTTLKFEVIGKDGYLHVVTPDKKMIQLIQLNHNTFIANSLLLNQDYRFSVNFTPETTKEMRKAVIHYINKKIFFKAKS